LVCFQFVLFPLVPSRDTAGLSEHPVGGGLSHPDCDVRILPARQPLLSRPTFPPFQPPVVVDFAGVAFPSLLFSKGLLSFYVLWPRDRCIHLVFGDMSFCWRQTLRSTAASEPFVLGTAAQSLYPVPIPVFLTYPSFAFCLRVRRDVEWSANPSTGHCLSIPEAERLSFMTRGEGAVPVFPPSPFSTFQSSFSPLNRPPLFGTSI